MLKKRLKEISNDFAGHSFATSKTSRLSITERGRDKVIRVTIVGILSLHLLTATESRRGRKREEAEDTGRNGRKEGGEGEGRRREKSARERSLVNLPGNLIHSLIRLFVPVWETIAR